jgi:hypothetical protein
MGFPGGSAEAKTVTAQLWPLIEATCDQVMEAARADVQVRTLEEAARGELLLYQIESISQALQINSR